MAQRDRGGRLRRVVVVPLLDLLTHEKCALRRRAATRETRALQGERHLSCLTPLEVGREQPARGQVSQEDQVGQTAVADLVGERRTSRQGGGCRWISSAVRCL